MKQTTTHLELSEAEDAKLINRMEADFTGAIPDHQPRMNKFLRYYRMWRSRIAPTGGDPRKSNYKVPLTKWQLLAKWAIEIDALFGDDAEVIAEPTAPLDEKNVVKIGRYMTWRVFKYMKCTLEFVVFNFYKLLFGRAFAYAPYVVEMEDKDIQYDGPKFKTLWMDNIILPADCVNIQTCSFLIYRYRTTPQELLRGEQNGLYTGVKDNFDKIYQASLGGSQRNDRTDRLTRQQDAYEGVNRDNPQGDTSSLEVWEWYGNWRMLKGKQDAEENDFNLREVEQTPVVIRYLPDARLIIGRQELKKLYPKIKCKRPFVTSSLIKDGSFWSPGMAEVLEDTELELTNNYNLTTDAGEKSVAPMIGYRPGSGFAPKKVEYQPGLAIPMDNPSQDLAVFELKFNPQFMVMQQQNILAIAERLFGINDQNVGRSIDRPNAPRTARGQLALIDQGSIRQSLDTRVLREDFREILGHLWQLDCVFGDKQTFFRATEEEAQGLFEVNKGFGEITSEERFGQMDFDIKFATSAHSKEQRKEQASLIIQAIFNLPIIIQSPPAQWQLGDDLLRAYGKPGMSRYMAKPPDLDMPLEPQDEWSLMLQGEEVHVHPMDDDAKHIDSHRKRLGEEQQQPADKRDPDAEFKMMTHIQEHQDQLVTKQQQQAQMQLVQQGLRQAFTGALGGQQGGEMGEQEPAPQEPNPMQQFSDQMAEQQMSNGGLEPL